MEMEIKGKTIDELKVGDTASFSKTVTEHDVYAYAGITGDFNPAHINEEYAEGTFFKTRIAHGILSAGFISAVLGTKLPGPGTIYIKQDLEFTKPVYYGDTITAICTVTEIIKEKNRVLIETIAKNQRGDVVVKGVAVVSPPK